jgi:ElaB/YqjD/DUF883 family membrane-anchored ribosome-binding protein
MRSTDKAREAAAEAYDQARKHAEHGAEQAAEAIGPQLDRIKAGAGYATDLARRAGTELEHRGAQLWDAQGHVTAEARAYTREHPLAAVGVAIAAGIVIGWLLRRK